MKLNIITPETALFNDDITGLNVAEKTGGFTILAQHAPLIATLKEFVATVTKKDGTLTFLAAISGTMNVTNDGITLMIGDGVLAREKDEAKGILAQMIKDLQKETVDVGDSAIGNLEIELLNRVKEIGDL